MTRPLRILVADGWYHVFGRGIERRAIFGDDRDRGHWLELLAEVHERYRFRVHAYALMENHYHAILQTPEANLSRGMQWLHGAYSAWFNARHQRVGPLFQGRFRAVAVEEGAWAYALSLYVHLNPLRVAGLGLDAHGRVLEGRGWRTPSPAEVTERWHRLRTYPWSSYRAYGGYGGAPSWLETRVLLARAHQEAAQQQKGYRRDIRRWLTHGAEAAQVERLADAVALGSVAFGAAVRRQTAGRSMEGIGGKREWGRRATPSEVRAAVESVKGEPWAAFADRRGDAGVALFLWAARKLCSLTLRELGAQAGGMQASAVCKAIRRLETQAAGDKALRDAQQRVLEKANVKP